MEISDGRKQKRGEGGNFIGTGGRGSRRGQELARGARQHDLSAAQQGCGGGGTNRWARPLHNAVSLIIQIFFKQI
jgi:hypothetical protein